jgi:rRNA maturation RNase YbeY
MAINFFNEDIDFTLESNARIKNWIRKVIQGKGFAEGTINYIFCSDNYLLDLNVKYLEHDTYTDIITFDYTNEKVLSGDIFISIDRVKENSENYNTSFHDELRRVIIHGILHLTGLKDKTESESLNMRKNENQCLELY